MKLFTLEEANELLPLVRRILGGVRSTHAAISALQQEAKLAAAGAERGGGGMAEGARYIMLLNRLAARSQELDTLGVQIKDYSRGLIDFPSMKEGRVVLLCWQWGEGDKVTWWHDIDAGFAGRQPL
jgi:hypothetical protein